MPAPPLNIQTARSGDAVVIKLDGIVDASTIDALRRTLEPLCAQSAARIVVDGSLLTYINSLGFGLLFKLSQSCRALQGRLVVAGLQDKLRVVFKILGLEKLIQFAPTCTEALASLAANSKP
ncbi:MAG TPA: STAS domain-containing protein [Kiritimatiellia bacterium]|nr:STAS domain-containing protein [Kiritimatiellia bacterium]HRZ13132.1 STAS domain-containing protein [Kiritimatiellia bacterium]HSA17553.1 STAS domain-containing protein [Kiritimatiellia bacterium]